MCKYKTCSGKMAFALIAAAAQIALHGAVIVTPTVHADSEAALTYRGVTYSPQQSVNGVSFVSTQALAGAPGTPEARTAGRVGGTAIAVNARLDDKFLYSFTDFSLNQSSVEYAGTILKVTGAAEDVHVHFVLPLSYVETSTNEELNHQHVEPAIFAKITSRFCTDAFCNGTDIDQFDFQAFLDDTFTSTTHAAFVTAQAGLDISALQHPTLTDSTVFDVAHLINVRTVHMEFGLFEGDLDLGSLSVGQSMEFSYTMQARVTGTGAANVGIASINDPFFFDTDPVTAGAPITVPNAIVGSVPEPGSLGLVGGALVLAALVGRRSGRKA